GAPGLFGQIRADPSQFQWLYATFLTTLLPTLLHLSCVLVACGPVILLRLRGPLARWVDGSGKNWLVRQPANLILSLWLAFSLTLPIAGVALLFDLVWTRPGTWANPLLDLFERFFHLLPGT
ncbi:MAG: hypothetical protein AAF408_09910, partial [Pseudomonadota bacterium]